MRLKLCRQILDGQNHITGGIVNRREPVIKGTADHCRNQLIHVCILGALCHDQVAVPKHGYLVADFKNLIHLVGNINQGNSLLL